MYLASLKQVQSNDELNSSDEVQIEAKQLLKDKDEARQESSQIIQKMGTSPEDTKRRRNAEKSEQRAKALYREKNRARQAAKPPKKPPNRTTAAPKPKPQLNEDQYITSLLGADTDLSKTIGSIKKSTAGYVSSEYTGSEKQSTSPPPKNPSREKSTSGRGTPSDRLNPIGRIPSNALPSTDERIPTGEKLLAGDQFYSILDIGVNSDEMAYIKATIIDAGPLQGATLLGMPETTSERSPTIIVRFDKLALDGEQYDISAIAINLETQRPAMADAVDMHYFERYFSFGLAAFMSGYTETLQDSTTTQNSNGDVITVRDSLPDTKDQVLYAVGNVGEELIPELEDNINIPPTVEVFAGREIGIMLS